MTPAETETPEARTERRRQHAIEYEARKAAESAATRLVVLRLAMWLSVIATVGLYWALLMPSEYPAVLLETRMPSGHPGSS